MRAASALAWAAFVLSCGATQQPETEAETESGAETESVTETQTVTETETVTEPEPEPEIVTESETEIPCTPPAGMACVQGGWFERGSDREDNEGSIARVRVDTFYMDTHEVTNALYTECVDAGVCERPFPYREFRRPQQPVVAMHWRDADAYCRWRSKRLPTEAEWERAARGPNNTIYPWGDEATSCVQANVRDNRGHGCGTEVTHEVGSLPAGHWGLFDMAGNVDEWVADWYAPCYSGCERECGAECAGENPRGPCDGAAECPGRRRRVVRGGSWWWPINHATGTYRRGKPPVNTVHHRYGFRCALSVAPRDAQPAPDDVATPPAEHSRSDG